MSSPQNWRCAYLVESSTDVCNAVRFSVDEIPASEDSVGTALIETVSIGGVSVSGKLADEGPNTEVSASESSPSECSAVTSCTGDGSAGRHSIGKVSVGGASNSELSDGEVSTSGGSFGRIPIDRASSGGYSVCRFPGEDSIAEISSGKASAGELSAGETSIGIGSVGEGSASKGFVGEVTTCEIPTGEGSAVFSIGQANSGAVGVGCIGCVGKGTIGGGSIDEASIGEEFVGKVSASEGSAGKGSFDGGNCCGRLGLSILAFEREERGNTCTGGLLGSRRSFRREGCVEKAVLVPEALIEAPIIRAFEIRACDGLRRELPVGSRIARKNCCRRRGKDFITDSAQLRARRETLDEQEVTVEEEKES